VTPLSGFTLRAVDAERLHGELSDPAGQRLASIDGSVLEALYDLEDGYLVISTDGDAYEDCLHLTLCDRTFAQRETVHLGGAYQTGRFRALRTEGGVGLRFSFFSDEIWHLEVSAAPRWRLGLPRPHVRHEPRFPRGRLQLSRER
jgi:hypothetical protein